MFEDDDKYRLTVIPCVEKEGNTGKIFIYKSRAEMNAAANSMADLLLFLQDEIKVMYDYSNMFIREKKENNEWVELDELDTELYHKK